MASNLTTPHAITKFVDDVARSVLEVERNLRAKGFLSGFVDEDWMREMCSTEEWRDHQDFRVEYAREVICSSNPAAVLHSDPGKYNWMSKVFERRIRRRLETHGEAEKLFSSTASRPNIELTEARRRLSRVLEKTTLTDRNLCAERDRKVALLKVEESVMVNDAVLFSRQHLLENKIDENALNRACLGYVRKCLASSSEHPQGFSDQIPLVVSVLGIICIRVHLEARIEKGGQGIHGAIFPVIIVSGMSPDENCQRIREDGFVYIHWMLAREFIPYSRFESRSELIVCISAWAEMLTSTLLQLSERGWKLELDACPTTTEPKYRH